MYGSALEEKSSLQMLGLPLSSKLNWGSYIISIDKTASKKIGALNSSMKFTIKGDLRPNTHPSFYGIISIILWKKSLVQSFVGALINSHKVMKLQRFKSGVNDIIAQMYKTFHPWFSLLIFVNFMEKELFTQFYVLL